jgi:hypothetical protein
VLSRQESAGKWGPATYALAKTTPADDTEHRTHRTDRRNERGSGVIPAPIIPMSPMPDAPAECDVPAGAEAEI